MRYRLMASYLGAPYQAGVGPSDRDVTLFAAAPPPEDHGFAPNVGHWRKQVTISDIDALWESRPVGTYRGEPCLVLDDLGDRLHIAYLGMDERRARQLGYWQVDRGVFEVVIPRHEVRDLAEDRHEFPLTTLRNAIPPAPAAYPQRAAHGAPGGPRVPALAIGQGNLARRGGPAGQQPRAALPAAPAPPAATASPPPPPLAPPGTFGVPQGPPGGMMPAPGQPPPGQQPPGGVAAWHGSPASDAAMWYPNGQGSGPAANGYANGGGYPGATGYANGTAYPNGRQQAAPGPPAQAQATPQQHLTAQPQPGYMPPLPAQAPQAQVPQAQVPQAQAAQSQAAQPATVSPAAVPTASPAPAARPDPAPPAAPPAAPAMQPVPRPSSVSALTEASPPGAAVRGRRAARKPRHAMSANFADLVDMADIPRSAYAVDDEVTGAMCLFKTDGGYEVFSCAEDARHEVRFFEDEEAAYFYLFGVLAAEALRNGRLKPARK